MVGWKRKGPAEPLDAPLDLASRIGMPGTPATLERPEPALPAGPELPRRVDGPIASARGPQLIGAHEPRPAPMPAPPINVVTASSGPVMEYAPLAATVREAPGPGEMDLVVMPLATPDDWHHFELALRRLPGVGPLRIEYYRHGILKLRVRWAGAERFAEALARVPGYRVGILGEDRTTVQIRVAKAA